MHWKRLLICIEQSIDYHEGEACISYSNLNDRLVAEETKDPWE